LRNPAAKLSQGVRTLQGNKVLAAAAFNARVISSVACTDPEVSWTASGRAIANGRDKTIHPHPTLGESIGMPAEIAHGSCTDVPPARK